MISIIIAISAILLVSGMNYSNSAVVATVARDLTEVNSDDTIENDIPLEGSDPFCDQPHDGSCYDRNDNPESFCVNYQQYTTFCEIIGEICDDGKSSNDIDSTDPECTDEDEECPDDYIRYGRYCSFYRIDCDLRPTSIYCDGKWRSDGLLRCDSPEHPAYKFCERKTN